jgi:hypothetical protein
MMNWAKYLRGEAGQIHCTILNTTHLSLEHCVQRVWNHLGQ